MHNKTTTVKKKMEAISWLLAVLIFLWSAFLFTNINKKQNLPPGPPSVPIIGNLLWLRHSTSNIEPLLRQLHHRYGPIITLRIGSRLSIFISDRQLAHTALITQGASFAGRPVPQYARRLLTANAHSINSAMYGPIWRLLRRNLVGETLHSSRVRLFSPARTWVLNLLIAKLSQNNNNNNNTIMENLQFAMFCLLVYMCFGEKLDEGCVKAIGATQRDVLLYGSKLNVFAFAPPVTKLLYRDRWETVTKMRQRQKELYTPLIKARKEHREKKSKEGKEAENQENKLVLCYVDTLLDLTLPGEGGRTLTDYELIVLCSEFLNAGTDTTSTALQWIMAELVKNPEIQSKLWEEIKDTVGENNKEVKEEMLEHMPYLKAVVLEGLRLHPPAHLVLPHAVTEEVSIGGYTIPKHTWVNFLVAQMGREEEVWEKAMEFKPERFLKGGEGEGVDLTGSREIKMMPFGVGRRICAGTGLAMFHLEYFVANLVREFEWRGIQGEQVDLSEKTEFTVVMKKPLRAQLVPRRPEPSVTM